MGLKRPGVICAARVAMVQDHEQLDAITEKVIGGAITVHQALGPGLLESIYRDCLMIELRFAGMNVQSDVTVPIQYRGQRARADLELDLLVERCVVVEVKAVERGCIPSIRRR